MFNDCTNFATLIVAYHRVFVEPGKVNLQSLPDVVKTLVDRSATLRL